MTAGAIVLGLTTVAWVFGQRSGGVPTVGWAQSAPSVPNLAAFSAVVEGKYQQLIVVDPFQRVIAVYHVRLETGALELKSIRNIFWDMQLVDYNGQRPLPQEIQSMIGAK